MSEFTDSQGSVPFWGPPTKCAQPQDVTGPLSAWGTVYLGGINVSRNTRGKDIKQTDGLSRIPGACDVKVSRSRKSKKESPANAGFEVIIPDGIELASVTISVSLWNEAQMVAMMSLLDTIDPRASGQEKNKNGQLVTLDSVTSFDVSHPACNMRKIRSIFVNSITGPDYEAGGLVKLTINATEWVKVPDKPKAPARKAVDQSKSITAAHTLDGGGASESSGGKLGGFTKTTVPTPRKPGV